MALSGSGIVCAVVYSFSSDGERSVFSRVRSVVANTGVAGRPGDRYQSTPGQWIGSYLDDLGEG